MKRLNVGIVGTSGWTEMMYLGALSGRDDVTVAGLCGRTPERTAKVAGKYGVAVVHADYRRLFEQPDLDAVIIASPDDQHLEMTLAALDRGLHVLCEKPLANTAADARRMLDAAERRGLRHMVLFTWRWQPHFRFLKSMVEEGAFGTVYRAQFAFLTGFARDRTYQWRHDPRRANGVVGDLASHMIDLGRWLFGDVSGVSAMLHTSISRAGIKGHDGPSGNDTAHIGLEFANGVLGVVDASTVAHSADMLVKQSVRIEAEKATLELEHIFFGARAGVVMRMLRADEAVTRDLRVPDGYFGSSRRDDFFDI